MTLKPEHAKLAAYFNLDNGTGRIRGIWMQGNLAAGPIFEQWMTPLKGLGITIIGPRDVASTDHSSFDAVGLPGFQFIQDRLEYNARTHHSNMDTYDRVQRDDLVQQATVAACSPTTRRCATRNCRGRRCRSRSLHEAALSRPDLFRSGER
jgi:hypothetical protein